MRKILFPIVALTLLFGTAILSLAQANTTASFANVNEVTFAQDNPLYFLENWREFILNLFAFTPAARANLQIDLATRRIGEIKHLVAVGRTDLVGEVRQEWQSEVKEAENDADQVTSGKDALLDHVSTETSRHLAVLEKVFEKAPDPAKDGLQNAINNAKDLQTKVLEHFQSKEKVDEVKEKIKEMFENTQKEEDLNGDRVKELLPTEPSSQPTNPSEHSPNQ